MTFGKRAVRMGGGGGVGLSPALSPVAGTPLGWFVGISRI